ncbi:kinetochore protein NDC80 [Pancytospora epiphaga]|nr:kinetochore protein NDC80 [Pancytospora epiphaga]
MNKPRLLIESYNDGFSTTNLIMAMFLPSSHPFQNNKKPSLDSPMLKRFTITPQPRKSIKIPSSTVKSTSFMRMSIGVDDSKPARNVRDKAYKQACADNITKFLTDNNYDGVITTKTLTNPSNKEFQSIFKFIYSFIDSTPFIRFEEDVVSILKLLKYPNMGEITKSQLSTVTPHAWPVLLSMMNWLVDLINKSNEETEPVPTLESEFYEYVCEGYTRFMEGEEDNEDLEKEFVVRMSELHSKETRDIENLRKEIQTLEDELGNILTKLVDLDKLEAKKSKVNEDLNTLIVHERRLEARRGKYISSIEKIAEEIAAVDAEVESLTLTKNSLEEQIGQQKVNPEDIKGMNVEKIGLLKELEKLKPERERLMKLLKELESSLAEKVDENENEFIGISSMFGELNLERDFYEPKTLNAPVISAMEAELAVKKECLVNYEMSLETLEERMSDKETLHSELEDVYSHASTKYQTIGSIYLEKKKLSDNSIQKNRNEMDKLDNDLLRLKLENDSALLKSEKDFSESKIKLDILISTIAREREDSTKAVWEFCTGMDGYFKTLDLLVREVKKLAK